MEVDARNLFLIGEFGYERTRRDENAFFQTDGFYYRAGVDVNLIPYDRIGTIITFGVRYSQSFFSSEVRFTQEDDLFGEQVLDRSINGASSQWLEAALGLKVKLNEYLSAGYTFKLRFAQTLSNSEGLSPFDIPGFGRSTVDDENRGSLLAVQFYLYYKLKFRDKPQPTRPITK